MKIKNILLVIVILGLLIFVTLAYRFNIFSNKIEYVDKLGITKIIVHNNVQPKSINQLQHLIKTNEGPISIVGAGYSQGGQTAYPDSLIIDMSQLNKIINIDLINKKITVQAGATWYDIISAIDSYNLSVQAMQSYSDFSIGGSLSVNVHGRDLIHCPLINSVESLEVILANGSLVTTSRTDNSDLFRAIIGGYGLLGVIAQATLQLTDNEPLERKVQIIKNDNFKESFFDNVKSDKSAVFYNTNVFPPDFKESISVTWNKTDKKITQSKRLQNKKNPHLHGKILEVLLRRIPLLKKARPLVEQISALSQRIVWRNYEMSYFVDQLAIHLHHPTTMTLQEYFIPIQHAEKFLKTFKKIVDYYKVNILNLSIRYVPQDSTTLLSYAPHDCFAFVLYINMLNTLKGKNRTCTWTRQLIDAALTLNGTFYLPYLICATKEQFLQAYPQFDQFLALKKEYDPTNKFRNMLFKAYGEE